MPMKRARRLTTGLLGLAMLACLIGCQNGTVIENCTGWHAIYPSKDDRLTPLTARAILAHDEYGARACGWKP